MSRADVTRCSNDATSTRGRGKRTPRGSERPAASLDGPEGRLAQGESTSLTRKGSEVQILYRPPTLQISHQLLVGESLVPALRHAPHRSEAEPRAWAVLFAVC